MRGLILGIDGYLGWSLACTLAEAGWKLYGIDNGLRRELVRGENSISAIDIGSIQQRTKILRSVYNSEVDFMSMDIAKDYDLLKSIIDDFQPNVIFHLAQIPSAPYSMKSNVECVFTHQNNMIGALNLVWAVHEAKSNAHIIKLGTMGEYGTPNLPIPEGSCKVSVGGFSETLPFPRSAGSWYHQTKVHDTHNFRMACNIWNLRCTDIMQGIVYGTKVEAMRSEFLSTRFDFDECFGTVINRFVVQAVCELPLTLYGAGTQIRSILPIQDSINCMKLLAENPAELGKYREVNQFCECMSLIDMAKVVVEAYEELTDKKACAINIINPRIEKEKHIYKPQARVLKNLGYVTSGNIGNIVRCMLIAILDQKSKLMDFQDVLTPTIAWTGDAHSVNEINLK